LLNGSSRSDPRYSPNGGNAGRTRIGHALRAGLAVVGLFGLGISIPAVLPGAPPDGVGPQAQDQPHPQTQQQLPPEPEPELAPVRLADAAAPADPPSAPATEPAPEAVAEPPIPLPGPDALHVLGSAIEAFGPEAGAAPPSAVEDDSARGGAARPLTAGSISPTRPELRPGARAKPRRAVGVTDVQPAAPRREAARMRRANRFRSVEARQEDGQALPSELRLDN
jgi:hypothetical protein